MKLEKDQAVLHILTEPCLLFKVDISVLESGFKLPEGKGWLQIPRHVDLHSAKRSAAERTLGVGSQSSRF